MNCAECRDNLVACLERLLDPEQSRLCQAHLEICAECRAEYVALSRLQERLSARRGATAEISLVAPVMRRVLQVGTRREGSSLMKLFTRWGLGALAGAAAILTMVLLVPPGAQAKAVD